MSDVLVEGRVGASTGTPVIILVRPQLAENIGMVARAMGNFGLGELRLVAPRDGWPQKKKIKKGAMQAASGATDILSRAQLFDTVEAAAADLNYLLATTARLREMVKPVHLAEAGIAAARARLAAGQRVGILFGPERTGLDNDDISLADAILTFPVNPAFSSVNLAQAVLLVGYEWFKHGDEAHPPVSLKIVPATRETLFAFFAYLEEQLSTLSYFGDDSKRAIISRNLRNILHRMELSEQDVRSLRGAVRGLLRRRDGG